MSFTFFQKERVTFSFMYDTAPWGRVKLKKKLKNSSHKTVELPNFNILNNLKSLKVFIASPPTCANPVFF